MLLRSRFLNVGLFFLLAALIGCSSNPSGPAPGNGDTTHHTLKITPDSSVVTVQINVTFTLIASPTPLSKPYTITWQIDNAPFFRANVDTFSCTFTTLGKHTVSAIYSDSTGKKRDSARTIVTVNDTSSGPFGLGSFKVVVNHDTLDRSQFQNTCYALVSFIPATPYLFSVDLSFSRTQFDGRDNVHIGLSGFVPGPIAATYPIMAFDKPGGFNGELDSTGVQFGSLDGGTFTITKFDTINNLVSGTFRMVTAKRQPTPDPNMLDTIVASFTDVGGLSFGQGNMTANINGTPFQPIVLNRESLGATIQPGTGVLKIDGMQSVSGGDVELTININTPQVGTFPFGDGRTPGTASCDYNPGHTYYTTQGMPISDTLTITAFDPVNRRISGTFNVSPAIFGTDTTIAITNGVLDNVMWVQE